MNVFIVMCCFHTHYQSTGPQGSWWQGTFRKWDGSSRCTCHSLSLLDRGRSDKKCDKADSATLWHLQMCPGDTLSHRHHLTAEQREHAWVRTKMVQGSNIISKLNIQYFELMFDFNKCLLDCHSTDLCYQILHLAHLHLIMVALHFQVKWEAVSTLMWAHISA